MSMVFCSLQPHPLRATAAIFYLWCCKHSHSLQQYCNSTCKHYVVSKVGYAVSMKLPLLTVASEYVGIIVESQRLKLGRYVKAASYQCSMQKVTRVLSVHDCTGYRPFSQPAPQTKHLIKALHMKAPLTQPAHLKPFNYADQKVRHNYSSLNCGW